MYGEVCAEGSETPLSPQAPAPHDHRMFAHLEALWSPSVWFSVEPSLHRHDGLTAGHWQ